MAVPLVVQYANQEQYNNLRLVAAFSELHDEIKLQSGSELLLEGPDTSLQLTQLNTICRYIAEAGCRKEQLLGSSPAARAQTSEWLSFRNTGLSPITDDRLYKISTHLMSRICLADSNPTLADLCLFATLHRAVASLPAAQADRFCNLIRWFDHMQHTVDTTGVYAKVSFRKPGLPEAVPPVIAATSKPTGAAAAQEKGTSTEGSGKSASSKPAPAELAAKGGSGKVVPVGREAATLGGPGASETQASTTKQAGLEPGASVPGGKQADPAKEAKKAAKKESRKEAEPKKAEEARIDMLDIRVGKIVEVGNHPTADTLYVEQIDLGEEKPRQVVSGLRKHVSMEEMKDRMVVVCTNLKPAKMREVMSYGMVLCASRAEKVSPLTPPPGTAVGTKIAVSGYGNEALAEVNPKKKILEKLKPDMATDESGTAMFKNVPFTCDGKPVTSTVPSGSVG